MSQGYFITGTDTGVGKTVVTAGLLAAFRAQGINAAAMKPVASGGIREDGKLISEDARFYLEPSNSPDITLEDINCYCFAPAVSPHLAAEMTGQTIDPAVIKQRFADLAAKFPVVLVEGAGGLCVPLQGSRYTVADLAKELALPLIVVAKAGLGTINHTVLTVKYAEHMGITVKGIFFNNCPPAGLSTLEENNAAMIKEMTGLPILGFLPEIQGLSVENNQPANLREVIQKSINWQYF